MVRKHRGDDFLQGKSRVKLAGKQYQGALLYLAVAFIHSPLPFIHCPQVCTLPHSRLPTHTLRAALLLEGAKVTRTTMTTADAGDPQTELEPPPLSLKSPVWKNFGFRVRYVDNICVVDKKASSAETRWQVILSFQLTEYISYCYIILLINVLYFTM